MASSEDVRVAFNIDMETRNLHKALRGFDQSVRKSSQQVGALGKALSRGHTKQFAEAEKAVNHFRAEVVRSEREILKNREDLAAASTEVQRESIQEQIKEFEALKLASIKNAKEASDEITEILGKKIDLDAFKKSIGDELKGGLEEGFASFKAKDISGLLKGGGKLGSGILKAIGGYGGAAAAKGGAALQKKGGEMGGGAGKAMQAMGGIMGKMAPMIGSLAKMGPILSMTAGIFAGIVKTMIDVESAGKAINKELMAGGSLAEDLAEGMALTGNAASKPLVAVQSLSDNLQTLKDQISGEWKMNLDMGTAAKDHYAVIDAMKKEGVSLKGLRDSQAESLIESEKAAASGQKHLATLAGGMAKYSGLTGLAVAYSRQFGVSLDEIGTLTGELMTELNTGATDMALGFAQMTTAALDSGIGVSKFFNIIRGVSSDLSLYGMRLKDVTKTLALMGKTMSPKTAAKFMQTLTQGFKGKSMQDRLKTSLLGGGGVKSAATEDVADKMDDLIGKVMKDKGLKDKGAAKAALESGDVAGPEREAYLRLQQRQRSLKEGGPLGTAAAMEDMGPAGVADAMKAAMMKFGGGKTLKDMTNIGKLATEQATGYSQEEQTQTMLFFESIEDQKKKLKKLFEKAGKKGEVLSDEEKKKMAEVQAAGMKNAEDVDKASTNKIFKSLDKSAEDQAKEAELQLKAAHESGKLSQSALDKLDVVIDALFNWLYKVLVSLWDGLEDILGSKWFGGGTDEKKLAKAQSAIAKTNNKELMEIASKAGSTGELHQNLFKSTGAKAMENAFYNSGKEADDLAAKQKTLGDKLQQTNLSEEERKKTQEEYNKVQKDGEAASGKYNAAIHALNDQLGGAGTDVGLKKERLQAGISTAMGGKIDYAKMQKAFSGLDRGQDIQAALTEGGFSQDEQAKILDKIRLQLSPEQLAKATADFQKATGTAQSPFPQAPPTPGTPGAPAAAQTVATAKSAAPGTGGVAPPAPAPVAPAAGPTAAGPTAPAKTEDKVVAETIADGGIEVVKSLQDLWNAMRVKGIKIDKTMTIENHFKKVIEEGSLAAIRKGLFEYAMYSTTDPKKLLDQMEKSGFSEIGGMAKAFSDDPKNKEFLGIKGNATGGIVTSVSGGIANIKPLPPGEGLASIGPGEKITPAGAGGGGSINLTVNGIGGQDLANFLKVKIAEGIYEYKRREKLT
jgi:predicted DNA-binding transcriptional regulator